MKVIMLIARSLSYSVIDKMSYERFHLYLCFMGTLPEIFSFQAYLDPLATGTTFLPPSLLRLYTEHYP